MYAAHVSLAAGRPCSCMPKWQYGDIVDFITIIEMEPGKRHALHAHMLEAATDWLNSLSLGTMSASDYIENLS